MGTKKTLTILFIALGLIVCSAWVIEAAPIGTAFTYQGHLYDANYAANGFYDFQFRLYDDGSGGSQIGTDVNVPDVDVIDAYFTVDLDFGNVFDGNDRWLQIGIRPGDQNDPDLYVILSPRQKITAAPYALYALNGSGGGSSSGADSDWTISGNDMYCGVSGNVGIGTTIPSEKLDVNGDISTASTYKIGSETILSIEGTSNTFLGVAAGEDNTTGTCNMFSGYVAGSWNTTGRYNTFSGCQAGGLNTTGSNNTFLGFSAGFNNEANYNTFLGEQAGLYNTTGYSNTFTGRRAGYYNTTGSGNTFLGFGAGSYSTVGQYNAFLGNGAGCNNKEGNYNTYLGAQAGYNSDPNGSQNVFIGYMAGYGSTGSNKLYISTDYLAAPLIYGEFDNGRVGIGTTSPTAKLQVAGQVRITGGSPGDGKVLTSDSTGLATWQPISAPGDNLGNHTATQNVVLNGHWLSGDGGNEGVYVVNDGRVGIGNPAPDKKLTVNGTVKATDFSEDGVAVYGQTTASGGTGVYGETADGAGVHGVTVDEGYGIYAEATGLQGNAIHAKTILGFAGYFEGGKNYFQGRVGIGTPYPERKLHVVNVMRLEPLPSAPSDPGEGDIYMNISTHKLMVYDGSTWQACW